MALYLSFAPPPRPPARLAGHAETPPSRNRSSITARLVRERPLRQPSAVMSLFREQLFLSSLCGAPSSLLEAAARAVPLTTLAACLDLCLRHRQLQPFQSALESALNTVGSHRGFGIDLFEETAHFGAGTFELLHLILLGGLRLELLYVGEIWSDVAAETAALRRALTSAQQPPIRVLLVRPESVIEVPGYRAVQIKYETNGDISELTLLHNSVQHKPPIWC